MPLFVIHKYARFARDFKVHRADCAFLPQENQRVYIDGFEDIESLLIELSSQVWLDQGVYHACARCRESKNENITLIKSVLVETNT
jgi:hypothetical protein